MDKAVIKEQIEEVNRVASKIAALLSALEAELAQAEKPELRGGDCGIRIDGAPIVIMPSIKNPGTLCGRVEEDVFRGEYHLPSTTNTDVYFNAFTHLRAISEPLTKFEFGEGLRKNAVELDAFRVVIRPDKPGSVIVDIKDLSAFIQNLQRLQYTARKKNDSES